MKYNPILMVLFFFLSSTGCNSGGEGNAIKDNQLLFSGYVWNKKGSETQQFGPGPNYFSTNADDLFVDQQGTLHLKVSYRNGRWYSTELISEFSFGYGTYVFCLGKRIDTIDKNITLGLFTWDDIADTQQVNQYREIDFEFSRWQVDTNQNSQFVVQPWDFTVNNLFRFNIDHSVNDRTIHSFTWSSSQIVFQSAYGTGYPSPAQNRITNWTYSGSCIPTPGNEKVHINFWQIYGAAPSDGLEEEMLIQSFQYFPLH